MQPSCNASAVVQAHSGSLRTHSDGGNVSPTIGRAITPCRRHGTSTPGSPAGGRRKAAVFVRPRRSMTASVDRAVTAALRKRSSRSRQRAGEWERRREIATGRSRAILRNLHARPSKYEGWHRHPEIAPCWRKHHSGSTPPSRGSVSATGSKHMIIPRSHAAAVKHRPRDVRAGLRCDVRADLPRRRSPPSAVARSRL